MSEKKKIKPKNNGKHPGGRPPTYTPEYLSGLSREMLIWFKKSNQRFWLKDFAIERGIPSTRFAEFAATSEEFSKAYNMCKDIQESRIVHKGFRRFQDRFASFALKNVSGWRDQQNITFDDAEFEITIGKKKI